jgi:RND superfamily putative drug exporter
MSRPFFTQSLARASARHPWWVIGLWTLFLVVGGLVSSGVSQVLTTEYRLFVEPESQRANRLLEERFPAAMAPRETLIVQSDRRTVDDPAYKSFVTDLLGEVRKLDGTVQQATSFYETGDPALVSADRRTTLLPVLLTGKVNNAGKTAAPLIELVHRRDGADGFTLVTGGPGTLQHGFTETSEKDLRTAEMIGLPLAILILLFVFGAGVAAGIPIVQSLISITIAVGLTAVIGRWFSLSNFVLNMITMIGLAVGIDYSLLIIERFREERRRGRDKLEAIGLVGATSSRAVLFSGGSVIVALIGLLIEPDNIFRSLAAGAIVVALVAIASALTLLPAVLSLLGDRVNALQLPFRRPRPAAQADGGFWARVTALVTRRPWVSIALTIIPLVALALPYSTINLGTAGVSTLPHESDAYRAYQILNKEFSAGLIGPAFVVVDGDVTRPEVQAGVQRLRARLQTDPIFGPAQVAANDARDLALLVVPMRGDIEGKEANAAVVRLRADYIPAAFAGTPAKVLVTGATAGNADYTGVVREWTPAIVAVVLGLSFLLLLVVFRSVVVPVKALIMNLLSVGAAYGLMVLVFQHGVGVGLLGFQQVEAIETWVPLFLFAVLFGLSMDYHVFLLSRIRERYDQTGDNRGSVVFGLRSTAGIITGAALIMVAVFSGFAKGSLVAFQQMGFGLAVAVILDATVIRTVLVPASMTLLGDWNWYLPRWLGWLPDIRVEGGAPQPARVVVAAEEPLLAEPVA